MAKIFSWVNFSQVIFGHFCQSIIILPFAGSGFVGFDWLSCISGAHASECLIFDVDRSLIEGETRCRKQRLSIKFVFLK